MNKETKINYLYKIAMGQDVNLSTKECEELSKYNVGYVGKPLTTKSNISQFVSAVDRGYRKGFYDWCLDNNKGDRRIKEGSVDSIKTFNREQTFCVILIGGVFWGLAIYWLLNGNASSEGCMIAGAIVSVIIYRLKREAAGFTCIILPLIISTILFSYN